MSLLEVYTSPPTSLAFKLTGVCLSCGNITDMRPLRIVSTKKIKTMNCCSSERLVFVCYRFNQTRQFINTYNTLIILLQYFLKLYTSNFDYKPINEQCSSFRHCSANQLTGFYIIWNIGR